MPVQESHQPSKEALDFLESLLSGTEPSTSSSKASNASTIAASKATVRIVDNAQRLRSQAESVRQRRVTPDEPASAALQRGERASAAEDVQSGAAQGRCLRPEATWRGQETPGQGCAGTSPQRCPVQVSDEVWKISPEAETRIFGEAAEG